MIAIIFMKGTIYNCNQSYHEYHICNLGDFSKGTKYDCNHKSEADRKYMMAMLFKRDQI